MAAIDFQTLREDVRGTDYLYRGQVIDLHGSLGERIMSKTRLDILIHQAANEIQLELQEQRNVAHNHMQRSIDTFPAPTDLLIISKIVAYDDDNEDKASGTATGATSATVLIDSTATFTTTVAVGDRVDNETDGSSALITAVDSDTQVTCGTLTGGSDNTFTADDEYAIYDPDAETTKSISDGFELVPALGLDTLREKREVLVVDESVIPSVTPSEGMPSKYMLYEQVDASGDGRQFFIWDVKPDARYFFDVFYYPLLTDMAGDQTTLKLRSIYQSLYYLKSCEKICQRLRDFDGQNNFMAQYERMLQKLSHIKNARTVPQSRFHLMP